MDYVIIKKSCDQKQVLEAIFNHQYNSKILKNQSMTESVKVMVRCRPMNQKQIERDCKDVIIVDKATHQIGLKKITAINTTVKNFAYDYVFGQDSTQQQVYEQSSFSLVENVLNGYNGTIFAYGQTGCGKTHTMLGVTTTLSTKKAQMFNNTKQNLPVTVTSLKLQQQTMGIIPRAFNQIMTVTNSQTNKNHLIQCTFIEIYNQEIHDLLGKDIRAKINLQQTPDGLIMKDLSVHLAKNVADMEKYMEIGYKNRVIRQTSMNKESSRSHCIFTIRIEESEYDLNGVQKFRVGKLNLVDLAGSQRQSKTNVKDDGIKQAAKINLSLSALGNVISALVDGKKQHIPYRDSKLTRILNDSLGGNTKTVMIATISPADYNYEQTLSTLRYSSRAKFIQNKPIINEDPKDALLRKYEEEIRRLKMILEGKLPYVRGNETIYLNNNNQKNQMNIFKKFPQLQNEENQAILDRMKQMNQVSLSIQKALKQHENQLNDPYNIHQNTTDKQPVNSLSPSQTSKAQNQEFQQLKKQLQFLQEIVKKQINTSPEVLSQLNKISELKQKLKQQALKQQQYKEQELKRQEQLLNIQKNYKNLNEQVDSIKLKFQDLRVKYVQTSQELKDARQAHQIQKEQILDALRIQQAQNNKLMQILNVIVPSHELQKIFKNCQWKDTTKQWSVPKFNFSQKSGVTVAKKGEKGFALFSAQKVQKKVQKQLQRVEKQKANKKPTINLIVEQTMQRNMTETRKMNQSEKRVGQSKRMSSSQRMIPLSRHQSEKQQLDINLYRSVQKERQKGFKNSYYSDSTRPDANYHSTGNNSGNKGRGNSTNKTDQKKLNDKYKLSLQSLPKIKVQEEKERPEKVTLDMEQIKREIMKEMMEKNRTHKKNNQ